MVLTVGPCLIERVVKKVIAGRLTKFYHLVVLDGGGKLVVPVDKAPAIGIRQLLERSEIPKLLGRLNKVGRTGCARRRARVRPALNERGR